ncbi:MAG: hypothetical protein IT425_01200, partial [Pirellulales bacterium]|nr:hypothetical protein [Pirellulales bacterium]
LNAPNGFDGWTAETIESQLAEVVWFSLENPEASSNAESFFGEPGMRTVYRRTLLIAPWLNPYENYADPSDGLAHLQGGEVVKPVPGLLRLLPTSVRQGDIVVAIASLVAFQDRYDISCRVEWDSTIQHWRIQANTLADLTKRENRFCHYGYARPTGSQTGGRRMYPFPLESVGSGYSGNKGNVAFYQDPEVPRPTGSSADAKADANIVATAVISYTNDPANYQSGNRRYSARPFVFVDEDTSGAPATAQAILNDDGEVVRVVHGPAPLWGQRRNEDIVLTDVLGFDLRVYDPGAPIFRHLATDTVLTPADPGWLYAYMGNDNMRPNGTGSVGQNSAESPYVGQGSYVDMGYGYDPRFTASPSLPAPVYAAAFASSAQPWFFAARPLVDVFGNALAPGFAVYDTWSFHYENNGLNEDGDATIDEGTNGLDNDGHYAGTTAVRLGVDDVGERETTPPYDKPLRGVQVILRAYERDSRTIRQVRVNQHFMQE